MTFIHWASPWTLAIKGRSGVGVWPLIWSMPGAHTRLSQMGPAFAVVGVTGMQSNKMIPIRMDGTMP